MLDPIVAIRSVVTLAPDESAAVHLVSGVAETREGALALIGKYRDRHFAERAFEMAWFQSQEILRLLSISEADAQIYGRLATSVIHGSALRRAAPNVIERNQARENVKVSVRSGSMNGPRKARSDNATSMHVCTPSISGHGPS